MSENREFIISADKDLFIDISSKSGAVPTDLRMDQNEEMFFLLQDAVTIPSFPIHHDVSDLNPDSSYTTKLNNYLLQISKQFPGLFSGLKFLFNSSNILKPAFYQIFKSEDQLSMFLMYIDLAKRPSIGEVKDKGDNDHTSEYLTNRVYIDPLIVPVKEYKTREDQLDTIIVHQHLRETWIGEFGRGHVQQGIWIDYELSKFFSKLLLPAGGRFYPYFPFSCRMNTMVHIPFRLDQEYRKKHLHMFFAALKFLYPNFPGIQKLLRQRASDQESEVFSLDLPLFKHLKQKVPAKWYDHFSGVKIQPYLNENNMKEYLIEINS
jgi:hypothetical protein